MLDRQNLIETFAKLNSLHPLEWTEDIIPLKTIVEEVKTLTNYNYIDLEQKFPILRLHALDDSFISEFINLNIFTLLSLKETFEGTPETDILSVQQSRKLRENIEKFIIVGICSNLQPNIPTYKKLIEATHTAGLETDLIKYNRLIVSLQSIILCGKSSKLHAVVLFNLKPILAAFYQIVYCPLKAPSKEGAGSSSYTMTEERYNQLMNDRRDVELEFQKFKKVVHISNFTRETMMIFNQKCPIWLKKVLSNTMDEILIKKKGIECISLTLLDVHTDYNSYDRAKTWKTLNVIVKLIFKFEKSPLFSTNIIPQIKGLLDFKNREDGPVLPFENLFILCLKWAYANSKDLFTREFWPTLNEYVLEFEAKKSIFEDGEDITEFLNQLVRLYYGAFLLKDADLPIATLPMNMLEHSMSILFYIYSFVSNSGIECLKKELGEIVVRFISENRMYTVNFDAFLFGFYSPSMIKPNQSLSITVKDNKSVTVNTSKHKQKLSTCANCDIVYDLFKHNTELSFQLFLYCLQCITQKPKYFCLNHNKDLISLEDEPILDDGLDRSLGVYNLLSKLSEDKEIQKMIIKKPSQIVTYFHDVLQDTINRKAHLNKNSDSDDFQTLFIVIMVIQALTSNVPKRFLIEYGRLLPNLRLIVQESKNSELCSLIEEVIKTLSSEEKPFTNEKEVKVKSDVDEAIECVCDPLLPVRGHGLMVLARLIENKDEDAMERKHYIFNILQQNLKTTDSYLYLSAVRGLAAMGDVFPDTVLNLLCEEYSDYKREDNDSRMKLGEVLVRVTRNLGEMAQKYKALLLNTFLVGTKDDDHLIRASSLSNLGEVCKVLGHRLGSILTEVLVCVHAVITTDTAVEARRAAVSVLRMLLAGLETDMITFLKEEILEIYRSLKNIYYNDADDVMRLQAQLALEELNENMNKILFAPPTLNFEKKCIILD